MFAQSLVGFVQVECGLSSSNNFHCSLSDLWSLMAGFGYELFGIYQQTNEFLAESPVLRRADAAFISPTEVEKNIGFSSLAMPLRKVLL